MPDMIFFFPPRSRGWTSTCSRRRHRLPPEEQKEVPTRSHHQKLSRRWDPPPNSNRYINTYIPFLKKALSAFEDGCNFVFATITRAVRNCNFIRHKKKTFFCPYTIAERQPFRAQPQDKETFPFCIDGSGKVERGAGVNRPLEEAPHHSPLLRQRAPNHRRGMDTKVIGKRKTRLLKMSFSLKTSQDLQYVKDFYLDLSGWRESNSLLGMYLYFIPLFLSRLFSHKGSLVLLICLSVATYAAYHTEGPHQKVRP